MLDLLKESKLFHRCSDQELEKVAAVCETKVFAAGERVFQAASPAEHLYIVSEGVVELRFTVIHYRASQEITVDRMSRGDVLGWSAVAESHTLTLSAVAANECKLLRMSGSDIQRLCMEDDHFGHVFMRNMAGIIGRRFSVMQRMLIDVVQDRLKKLEPED